MPQPSALVSIDDLHIEHGGKHVIFTLKLKDGTVCRPFLRTSEIEKTVSILLDLGQQAFQEWPEAEKSKATKPASGWFKGWMFNAFEFSLGDGRTDQEKIVFLHLGYTNIPICLPIPRLVAFAQLVLKQLGAGQPRNH